MYYDTNEISHAVLKEVSERESQEPTEDIFRELGIEKDKFPAEPIEGQWI